MIAVLGIMAYVLRVLVLAYLDHQRGKLWKQLPTVDEYLRTANPTKGAGISCTHGRSRQLMFWCLSSTEDLLRLLSTQRLVVLGLVIGNASCLGTQHLKVVAYCGLDLGFRPVLADANGREPEACPVDLPRKTVFDLHSYPREPRVTHGAG